MLQILDQHLVAKIGFDTAKSGPPTGLLYDSGLRADLGSFFVPAGTGMPSAMLLGRRGFSARKLQEGLTW